MSRSSANEIIEGYIEEVRTYIPSLNRGIESLRKSPGQEEVLRETHRLVHTIKGASAMVGIHGLSHVACQMEDALDDMIAGEIGFDEDAFRTMSRTVGHFQTYCTDFFSKGVDARAMLRETVPAFRRLRGLPGNEDEAILEKLFESVPLREGAAGEEAGAQTDEPEKSGDEDLFRLLDGETDPQDMLPEDMGGEVEFFGFPDADGTGDPEGLSEFSGRSDRSDDAPLPLTEVLEESDLPPELLESFYEEAEEHLQDLGRSLNILETQVGRPVTISPAQREIIGQIRRSVHTLKGASSVVGLPNIPGFAHCLEDLLDWLYERAAEIDPDILNVLAESADLLEHMVAYPLEPRAADAERLKARYKEIVPDDSRSAEGAGMSAGSSSVLASSSDSLMPELLESFYEEAEDHLQELGRSLSVLEAQIHETTTITPDQREVIRGIRRSVHTLKGASSVVGLPNIPGFTHGLEDLLDWLYEKAREIGPDILHVLGMSADVLERMVADPQEPQTERVEALRGRFAEISQTRISASETPAPDRNKKESKGTVEELPVCAPANIEADEDSFSGIPFQAKTLRVGTERVDELVNLVGELIIATSAFDQKMDIFMSAVNELELSRDRLRDISRDMEVGYEVKALGDIRNPKLEIRNSKSETRNPKLEIRNPKSETRNPESETNQGLGTRHPDLAGFEDFDSLELDRYSELSLIIRSLNESAIDVGLINTHLSNLYSDFDGHLNRQRVLLSELQNKMMRIRMTPMSVITNKLRRIVRETSAKLGKKIRLIIEGADIELDRTVWEKITDPLMHLLRNATDHGVEPSELRQAMGKPPVATIKLAASREGNQVLIRVMDDGAGLNFESIRASALKAGIHGVQDMDEDELASLIFQPGFSTRGKISEVSGRGVGMDVVKENIQELKGTVRVRSWKDKGAQFSIRIPLTLAAVRALLFTSGGQTFAIALNDIKEIFRIAPEDISGDISPVVRIGHEALPFHDLSTVLNIRKDETSDQNLLFSENTSSGARSRPIALVLEAEGRRGAFAVDTLMGQKEIVIKSTGSHLRYVRGVSGATIMGDGSVVPILNTEELFQWESSVSDATASLDSLTKEEPLEIMVVDDSVSIRQVVSRLMGDQGWKVRAAKDGIDALAQLREGQPDLIVLDIEMPRMNGYEFLSAIRAQPTYQQIPVVMLTSRAAAKHRNKAISLGARGFVVKPYNDDEFVDLVIRLTDK